MWLPHVGEGQPVGVPPQIHVLHVTGPQLAGDQGPNRVRRARARLNKDVTTRRALFRAVMVLNETVGMISFSPGLGLEEHDLFEIHVRTGQHHLPSGTADLHPPFPMTRQIGRRRLSQMPMYDLQRLQSGNHSLPPCIPATQQSVRRHCLCTFPSVLSRFRKTLRRPVHSQADCLKYEIALQRGLRFQREAFLHPDGCVRLESHTLVGIADGNESPCSQTTHERIVVFEQCCPSLRELLPAGIVRQPSSADAGGNCIQQLSANGRRLDGLLRRQGIQHGHRILG